MEYTREYTREYTHEFPQLVTANGVSVVQDNVLLLWKCVLQDDLVESRHIIAELLGTIRYELCSNTNGHTIDRAIYWSILENLFCFIAHVRDIHMGLGKRQMTYMMLDVWYDYFPILAIKALHTMVSGAKVNHSYGSWRDICGLCEYLKKHSHRRESHPLIDTAIEMMNFALHKENMHYYHNKTEYLTNIAKWVPREKSQFKWLFPLLVIHWSQTYGQSSMGSRKYRRMVSKLTRVVNPVEQNLCAQTRDNITVDSLSNISIVKNWGSLQLSEFDDTNGEAGDKGCYYLSQYFTFPEHITKLAQLGVRCIEHNGSAEEINLLNSQWSKSFHKWTKRFSVDKLSLAVIHSSSISMHDQNLCKSIAHACYIVGASDIKRILYASNTPIWINLEHCDGFIAMIRTILNALRREFISCLDENALDTNIDMAIQTMGEGHPFLPVVFTDSGLYSYNHSRSFYDFFSIMDSSRYRCMNQAFISAVS